MRYWLPENDLVYFIMEMLDRLDLRAIYDSYDGTKGGQPAFDPRMMVGLVLYAYCIGLPSSRKIEQATYYQVPFRVLTADQHPDHDTIASFRKCHLKQLSELFVQVLHLCRKVGLVKFGHVALDGTKVRANASKHKSVRYDRAGELEQKLRKDIAELMQKAERSDNEPAADEQSLPQEIAQHTVETDAGHTGRQCRDLKDRRTGYRLQIGHDGRMVIQPQDGGQTDALAGPS